MAYFVARMIWEASLVSIENGQNKYRAYMKKTLVKGYKAEIDAYLSAAPFNCPECIVDVN